MVPQRVLEKTTRRLVRSFDPVRIILFGSQARGRADDRSDADRLVICPVDGDRAALALAMDGHFEVWSWHVTSSC